MSQEDSSESDDYSGLQDICEELDEYTPDVSSTTALSNFQLYADTKTVNAEYLNDENEDSGFDQQELQLINDRKIAGDDEEQQRAELTLEIIAFPKDRGSTSLQQSAPVTLSACREATVRMGLHLSSSTSHLLGRIVACDGTVPAHAAYFPENTSFRGPSCRHSVRRV